MKVYWCRADELRDECEGGADTTVVEYAEANAEVCQLKADCDQHEDRIAQLNEILHGERSEIALLREAIRREAERHSKLTFYIDGAIVRCPCEVCLIAREGR